MHFSKPSALALKVLKFLFPDATGWDLRFPEKGTEASFKKNLEAEVVRLSCFAYVLCSSNMLVFFATRLPPEVLDEDNPFKWASSDPRTCTFGGCLLVMCIFVIMIILTTLRMRWGWFTTWNWERRTLLVFTALCVLMILNSPFLSCSIYGLDPLEVWKNDATGLELNVLLSVDTAITLVCLFIPIRVHILWVLQACGMTVYVAQLFAFGSPFPHDVFIQVGLLCALSVFAYLGAWRIEMHVREKWLALQQIEQQQVELDESSVLTKGMQSVLSGLCDVVFKLSKDCKALGENVGRDNIFGCAMEGTVLTSRFVEDTSTLSFQDVLERACSTGLLQVMNAAFWSGCGSEKVRFDAEFFVVHIHVKQHNEYYLVGMRMPDELPLPETLAEPEDLPLQATDMVSILPEQGHDICYTSEPSARALPATLGRPSASSGGRLSPTELGRYVSMDYICQLGRPSSGRPTSHGSRSLVSFDLSGAEPPKEFSASSSSIFGSSGKGTMITGKSAEHSSLAYSISEVCTAEVALQTDSVVPTFGQGVQTELSWMSNIGFKCLRCSKPPPAKTSTKEANDVAVWDAIKKHGSRKKQRCVAEFVETSGSAELKQHQANSSCSSSCSSSSSGQAQGTDDDRCRATAKNGFATTPLESIKGFLEEGIMRISVDAARKHIAPCCPWHMALCILKSGVKDLQRLPCDKSFTPSLSKQCISCMMLADDDEDVCGVCAGDLYGPGWQVLGNTNDSSVRSGNGTGSQDVSQGAQNSEAMAVSKISI